MLIQSHAWAVRLMAIACLGLFISLAQAETLTGQVVKIADGDTLTVLDASKQQHKIRLAGIDAPEKSQAFGTVAKQNLAALVFGRMVTVEWSKRDRFHRILGKVLLNGEDINLEQIRAGLAWHYSRYAKDQLPADRELYALAEAAARSLGAGLWHDAAPVPPWDFRRK